MGLLIDTMQVHTLLKQREDSTEAKIQIISTPGQPLLAILRGFYTTVIVNLISWNKAYALYPQSSFLHHKTYLLTPMNDHFGQLLAKYEMRGWIPQDILWPEDEALHSSILQDRRVGDRWTWIISFNNTGVDYPEMPDSVLEYSTFCLKKVQCPYLGYYTSNVLGFDSLVLKYEYTNAVNRELRSGFWSTSAGPRLERLSLLGLFKTPRSSRPQFVQDVLDRTMSHHGPANSLELFGLRSGLAERGLELPSYDHVIPGWYAQWEEEKASRVSHPTPANIEGHY